MNILFYRYGSICEPDLIEAFREYGLNVVEDRTEITNKQFLPAERVKTVGSEIERVHPLFVFTINFFPDISDVCNICRVPYMCLIVDSPVLELYSDSIKHPYNRIFLFDMAQYNEFHQYNPDCIFHIPLATNVKRWDKVINAAPSDRFASDVSFVGSLYTEKCPFDKLNFSDDYVKGYVNGIIEAQLGIYGYYFVDRLLTDKIVSDILNDNPGMYTFPPGCREDYRQVISQLYIGSKISAEDRVRTFKRLAPKFNIDIYTGSDTSQIPGIHNRGLVKTLTEMPVVFNRSRINLNITSRPIREGLPLRIFDVLGCGGFLITNYQSELTDYFNLGEHLVAYQSADELEYLIDYYLSHEEERREIAHNGYVCVRDSHNYTVRVGQMIQTAFGNVQ